MLQAFDLKAKVNNSSLASRSQEIPCKIPPSYKISPETLEKVRVVMNEDVSDTIVLFKALSDPIRVRILKALRIKDLCVCVLVELLDCEYSKLSYHLKLLKEAGLIECKKEGCFLIYHLTESGEQMLGYVGKI
ncbi:ArsR family transcriptional regulator [ANME-1 cluster archaeon GoMg4]|nr:ArsR family transcriptional regulator [ANME-1 cluster archaeon GoMg4]